MNNRQIRFTGRRSGGRARRCPEIGSRAARPRTGVGPRCLPCRGAVSRTRGVCWTRRREPRCRLGSAIRTPRTLARRGRGHGRVGWDLVPDFLRRWPLRWEILGRQALRRAALRRIAMPVGNRMPSTLLRRACLGRASRRALSLRPGTLGPGTLGPDTLHRYSGSGSAVPGSARRWVPSGRRTLPLPILCPRIVQGTAGPGRTRLLVRFIRSAVALPVVARVGHRWRSSAHSLTLLRRPVTGALGVTLPQVLIPIRQQPLRVADSSPPGVRYRRADRRRRRCCESARADRSPAGSSGRSLPVTTDFPPPTPR